MKTFTSIEQSKKLAEILPLESADMLFHFGEYKYADSIRVPLTKEHWKRMMPDINPCWSLVALLQIIPKNIEHLNRLRIDIDNVDFSIWYDDLNGYGVNDKLPDITLKEPVDACYEMVLKLHDLNLL